MEKTATYDLIIVGAGAAGLMAAVVAGRRGLQVLLLEKMERPGRKLLISGKGRCNVCNCCTVEEFLPNVTHNPRFLYSSLYGFDPYALMAFFEELGVPLKVERGQRVFPQSDRSMDIVDALCGEVRRLGVTLRQATVKELLLNENTVEGVRCSDGASYRGRSVLLATGGKSYPATGSTGDGYALARQAGHRVTALKPSLVPLVTVEDYCPRLMGLSLRNVTLRVSAPGEGLVFEELGELLFTHFGVSGPLVLSASSLMKGDLSRYSCAIDLKPGLSPEQLDARLLRDFEQFHNKDFTNALSLLLPKKLIPVLVELSGIPAHQKVHQVTREQRQQLCALIKAFPFHVRAFRPIEEAIVTSGGVEVSQVDPKTLGSKLCRGLYFAGELLDLDAYTGGFNLQIAFSTAYAAASHCCPEA